MKHLPWPRVGLFLVVVTQAACYESQYIHTVVHPDGSVDRAVVQSPGLTPDAARRPGLWQEMKLTKTAPELPWDGSLASLVPASRKDEETYVAARGHFASVADLPDHYGEWTVDRSAHSRLVRSYSARDLGLVTEHVWTETLTDVVGPDEARQAREEWAAINRKLLEGALGAGLGPAYEYAAYLDWVTGSMRAFASALLEARVEARAGAMGGRLSDAAVDELATRIAARAGLPLDEAGINKLVREKTTALVRRRDGTAVDAGLLESVARGILDFGDDGAIFSTASDPTAARLKGGRDQVIAREFGGPEAFSPRMKGLLERALGIGYADSERVFNVSLRVPGTIVETNGVLWSDGDTEWSFKLADAALFGFTMRCRSLEAPPDRQQALLSATPLTGRPALLRFVTLVEAAPEIQDVLRRSVRDHTMAPLEILSRRGRTSPGSHADGNGRKARRPARTAGAHRRRPARTGRRPDGRTRTETAPAPSVEAGTAVGFLGGRTRDGLGPTRVVRDGHGRRAVVVTRRGGPPTPAADRTRVLD